MRKFLLLVLYSLLITTQLMAQNRTVTGKITDQKGSSLANVSVQVKGTNNGTVSNEDGTYSLNVPANAKTLVYSFADMETKEVSIGAQSTINVSLKPNDKSLQEVMVVGYGTQRKKDQTGAISTISGQEFENRPFTSFDKIGAESRSSTSLLSFTLLYDDFETAIIARTLSYSLTKAPK